MTTINPLLIEFILPPFSDICPEHVVPAIKSALDCCRNTVDKVLAQTEPFTWENLCLPIAEAEDRLSRIWSPVNHLNSVKNNQKMRCAYEQSLSMISAYGVWIGQHKDLYQAYRKLRDSQHYLELDLAKQKVIENSIRDFTLSGMQLAHKQQLRYAQIVTRLSQLGSMYNNNVLDSTVFWSKLVTEIDALSGVPKHFLKSARARAEANNQEGWLLTLDVSSYIPIITYCDNSSLREEIYRAYSTRASDQGPNAEKWNNGPIINEILALRHELAQLLGFNTYMDKSVFTKMAAHSQKVFNFLTDLSESLRFQGEKELSQLYSFTKKYFNRETLNPWDIAYYSEKQKRSLFFIDNEQLRSYFPEPQVLKGLFEIIRRIYGVFIKERNNVDVWHTDVRFFDLLDENNNLLGSFYLDLYDREHKQGGAWMDDCACMIRKLNGKLQKPIAFLTCNFSQPLHNTPAMFTHNEVITLFHEFGHGLHHILTRIDTPGVAGINGVPWDAVELPSQLMENYCWKPESLALISCHYETGKPLPNKLLHNLLATKNYQAALSILRQIELALFDFRIHYEYQSNCEIKILEVLDEVKNQVGIKLPSVKWARFPHSFSHIFSGGYAAGYYSYLWANVLSADAWSLFEEKGIFNKDIGKSFLENILSKGGSEDPMKLFTRFRGRQPSIDAMLRYYGIKMEDTKK